jgi:hypothetical protein
MDRKAMIRDYQTWAFDLPSTNIHYAVIAFPTIDPLKPAEEDASIELGRHKWKLVAWMIAWFHFRFRHFASVAVMKVDGNGNVWIPLSWIRRRK